MSSSAAGFNGDNFFRGLGIQGIPNNDTSCFDYSQNCAILSATVMLPVFFILFLCFATAFAEDTKFLLAR